MATIRHTICRDGPDDDVQEIVVEATGHYVRGHRGSRWEPPELPNFEIDTITDLCGNKVELTDDELDELVEAALRRGA